MVTTYHDTDVVDIPAGIDAVRLLVHHVPQVAAVHIGSSDVVKVGFQNRLNSSRRVCQEVVRVVLVPAKLVCQFEVVHECFVEVEEQGVLFDKWHNRHRTLLPLVLAYDRIVHESACHVEVVCVVHVEHGRRHIWHVSSCIRLACDVDLELGDSEDLLEVLEEADEVCSRLFFRCCRYFTLTETETLREASQVSPASDNRLRTLRTIGYSTHSMFVRFGQPYGFSSALYIPHAHWKRP